MLTHRRPSACARRRLAGLETPAPMAPAGRGGRVKARSGPSTGIAAHHTQLTLTRNSHSHSLTLTLALTLPLTHDSPRACTAVQATYAGLSCMQSRMDARSCDEHPPPLHQCWFLLSIHAIHRTTTCVRACVRALVMYVKASHRAAVRKWSRPVPREAEAALPSPHACCAPCCEVVRLLDGGISDPRVESHPTSRIIDSSTDTIKQNKTILQAGHG